MALNSVTVRFGFENIGSMADGGTVTIAPTSTVTVAGNQAVFSTDPVTVTLDSTGAGTVSLLPTDTAGTTPPPGQWAISFTVRLSAGTTFTKTKIVNFSAGATQNFSDLPDALPVTVYGSASVSGGGGVQLAGDLGGTDAVPQVTGTHLAAPLPVAQGGTGQASLQSALNVLTGPQVAGKYVRSDGTNAGLDAIHAADVPQLAQYNPAGLTGATAPTSYAGGTLSGPPVSGTWTQGQWVVDQTGKIYACVAGGSPGTWRRVGANPWQFFLDDYCVGDGQMVGDLVTNGTAVVTSVSGKFASTDVGKHVMINGANGIAAPLIGTVASYQSPTQVTLSGAASATATGCAMFWCTDDQANVNACIAAARAYALANNYLADVICGAKPYGLASAPTQTSTPAVYNTQVSLPYPAINGTSEGLVVRMLGAGNSGRPAYWMSTVPDLGGTCFVSMITAPSAADSTFGNQSVIGGPAGGGAFGGGYANTKPVMRGITVVVPAFANQFPVDFRYVAAAQVEDCAIRPFCPANAGTGPLMTNLPTFTGFQNALAYGLYMPVTNNNDDCLVSSVTIEGITNAIGMADHLTVMRLLVADCHIAGTIDLTLGGSNQSHTVTIQNWSAENVNGILKVIGGGFCAVNITIDGENTGPAYDVSDPSNALRGVINWSDLRRTGAGGSAAGPTVVGAANVKIINNSMGPGPWNSTTYPSFAPPAAPASGTAQQNTSYRDGTVWVTSTAAITAVSVDGTQTFAGSVPAGYPVPVPVPGGHSYAVTSAGGTLTTKWSLN